MDPIEVRTERVELSRGNHDYAYRIRGKEHARIYCTSIGGGDEVFRQVFLSLLEAVEDTREHLQKHFVMGGHAGSYESALQDEAVGRMIQHMTESVAILQRLNRDGMKIVGEVTEAGLVLPEV